MDPIAVDVPARVPPAPAATTAAATAAKPPALPSKPEPAKSDAPKADPAKPPFPTPAPAAGAKSVLGKVANALGLQPTRRQAVIAGAAAVSLVAGIAAVRLITPEKKPDAAGQPLVAEAAKGGTGNTPSAAETPKHTPEADPPAPAAAPLAPLTPSEPVVKLPDVPLGPTVDVQHEVPPSAAPIAPPLPVELPGVPSAKTAPPPVVTVLPPTDPGVFGPAGSKTTPSRTADPVLIPDPMVHAPTPKPGEDIKNTVVPSPVSLVPDVGPPMVVPAAASEPAKPAAPVTPVAPPMTPTGSGISAIAPPVLPTLPGDKPVSLPAKPAGLPAVPPTVKPVDPSSLVPPIGGPSPMVPAVPPVGPPMILPAVPTSTGGPKPTADKPVAPPIGIEPVTPSKPMTINLTKPAGATDPKPAAGPERAATTSYDVDLHEPKSGDTYDSISREFYNDTKYAAALREYNGRRPLTNVRVEVPPIHVLKKQYPQLVGPVVPVGRTADGWGPSGGGGNVAPAFQPTGARTYTVPTGGMKMVDIARTALGSSARWQDIYNLNPQLPPNEVLPAGTLVKLPAN